ncbi:MAG: TerB N-terminal domain-containing protein [Candidatus Methanomethylophilaceae archaeon]|nr:TerB N-terminal domain-containing protein [Candidatus Methanomethylophilaceae archaeon]
MKMSKATVHPSDSFKDTHEATDLLQSVGRYWRYGGTECEYVPSLLLHPTYRELEWKRLRYYLYWRQRAFEGEYLDTDAGYVWLHCVELITVDDDPLENMRCLIGMRDAYLEQDPAVDSILGAACAYYATVIGYYKRDFKLMSASQRCVRICGVLSDRGCVPLSARDLKHLIPLRGRKSAEVLKALGTIVSSALHEIGRQQNGILRLCRRQIEFALRFPFSSDMSTYGMKSLYVKCEDPRESEQFMNVFKDVYNECDAVLSGKTEKAGGKYGPLLNRCIDAYKNGRLNPEPYDKYGIPIVFNRVSYHASSDSYQHPERDGTWPSHRFQSRMREYGGIPTPPSEFRRPPRTRIPCYSTMTLDEYIGYQSWKNGVLKGEKTEKADGYAWLLANEIINDDTLDPGSALRILEECADAPGGWQGGISDDVVADWCILHGLYSQKISKKCDSQKLSILTVRALRSFPPLPLSREQIDRASVKDADDEIAGAVNAAVLAVYKANGDRLDRAVDLSLSTTVVRVFEDCAGMPISVDADVPSNPGDVNRFVTSVCRIAEAVISGDKDPKTPAGFGKENRNATVKAILLHLEEERRKAASPSKVALDMDAVKAAMDDLDAVTGMMRVDDDEEPEEEPTDVVEASTGDPWKDLRSRLQPDALEYLRKCMDGTRFDSLKEKKVNEAAMETVGDAVVEDGTVIDDYADDVARLLSERLY